jgi:hypothetical protein
MRSTAHGSPKHPFADGPRSLTEKCELSCHAIRTWSPRRCPPCQTRLTAKPAGRGWCP